MSESSAPERPQPNPDSANTKMSKEYPPTADMRIMAEIEGPRPKGVDFSSDKPNFTFQIGKEPDSLKAPGTQPGLEPIVIRASSESGSEQNGAIRTSDQFNRTFDQLHRDEDQRPTINSVFDNMTSDHFNRALDEATRQTRDEGVTPSPEHTAKVIRETADKDDPNKAWLETLDKVEENWRQNDAKDTDNGSSEQKHGSEIHNKTGRNGEKPSYLRGEMPSYSTAPYGDHPDPFATGVGDLPPGPSTGEYAGPMPEERPNIREHSGSAVNTFDSTPYERQRSRITEDLTDDDLLSLGAFGTARERAGKPVETEVDEATTERGKRLADLLPKSMVKGLMERARKVAEKLPEPKLKLNPKVIAAIAGVAGVIAVLMSGGDRENRGTKSDAMPGNQYDTGQYVGRPGLDETSVLVDRPQLTSVPPVVETMAPEEPLPSLPDSETVRFPDSVTNRSLDGLIKKKMVELDPEFQKWLKETNTDASDVPLENPQFQAALYRLTQKYGGPNLDKMTSELVAIEQKEIKVRNKGRILNEQNPNKIDRSQFEIKAVDEKMVAEAIEKVKKDKSADAKAAREYIKGLINTSPDPEMQQMLEGLENSDRFTLTHTISEKDSPYQMDLYDVKGDNNEPLMTYQVERRSDGSVAKAINYRKDENGKFITVKMGNEVGLSDEDQKKRFSEEFPDVDQSTFKTSMGMYEDGGFGHSYYGDWIKDGVRYSGGIDAVGRISVRTNP